MQKVWILAPRKTRLRNIRKLLLNQVLNYFTFDTRLFLFQLGIRASSTCTLNFDNVKVAFASIFLIQFLQLNTCNGRATTRNGLSVRPR